MKTINNCLNLNPLCMLLPPQGHVLDGLPPSHGALAVGFQRPPTCPNVFLILAAEMSPHRKLHGQVQSVP